MTRILIPVPNLEVLYAFDRYRGNDLRMAGYDVVYEKGCYVDSNRNKLITGGCIDKKQTFLDGKIIFIDSDQRFEVLDVIKLEARLDEYPIVCVPYNTQFDNGLDSSDNPIGEMTGLVPVEKAATGFLGVQNYVFNKLEYPYFWRPLVEKEGKVVIMGEDVYFSRKAIEAGFELIADYNIKIGHDITKNQIMKGQKCQN